MAINLKKNEQQLLAAWKEVVDDKCETNWALFGYENDSNALELVAKGKNGLDELIEELNVAQILYAFCRILDENTELPKFVLINWQGEGVHFCRKGLCANHVLDVAKFFRGIHLRIDARNEDDIDQAEILDKLRKSPNCKFSFNDRVVVENTGPVGTNYKKIEPQKELNTREREKFWIKQKEEEEKRKIEEKKIFEEEKKRREQEVNDKEANDTLARETLIEKKEAELERLREMKKNAENSDLSPSNVLLNCENQEKIQTCNAPLVKKVRAFFEQNTAAGQLASARFEDENKEKNKVLEEINELRDTDKNMNNRNVSARTINREPKPEVQVAIDEDKKTQKKKKKKKKKIKSV